jgi:hypothetical protein
LFNCNDCQPWPALSRYLFLQAIPHWSCVFHPNTYWRGIFLSPRTNMFWIGLLLRRALLIFQTPTLLLLWTVLPDISHAMCSVKYCRIAAL